MNNSDWVYIQDSISMVVLRELRERKWTRRELAFRSGVDVKQISKLVNNRADWWLRDMWFISKAFGVPIDYLIPKEDAA